MNNIFYSYVLLFLLTMWTFLYILCMKSIISSISLSLSLAGYR